MQILNEKYIFFIQYDVKKVKILKKATVVHFVGVGGVSMSALAKYCLILGYSVTGSDEKNSAEIQELKKLGVKIFIGHKKENVHTARIVVKTGAVLDGNAEIQEAKRLKIPIIRRSELLGSIVASFSQSVGVSGSHGKTTATAMIARVLDYAGKSPVVFIGGRDSKYGNFHFANGEVVVTEACEFQRSFLDIKSTVSVALNIDNDHLDCYKSMEDLSLSFRRFLSSGIAVINADDTRLKGLCGECSVTFGIENSAVYKAERLRKLKTGGYSFTLYKHGVKLGRIHLKVLGKHNVYNALSAIAVGGLFGIPIKDIKRAIEDFNGVERRMENLGAIYEMQAFADYAHHPTEIMATISAFDVKKDDIIVFQPHTYSRTKLLIEDFKKALGGVNTLIYATYPAREEFDAKGSAYSLYRELKKTGAKTDYASTPNELFSKLKKYAKTKKRVLFVGAGDIYDIAKGKSYREKRK